MPLIQEIESELPLVAELPVEWQKDIALILSKIVIAHDNTLTMTPQEQKEHCDREMAVFQRRFGLKKSE